MLFVLVPHTAKSYDAVRYFQSYSAVEQAVLVAAKDFERKGGDPDWCSVIAYDGVDELLPIFLYFLVGSARLVREKFPSPSP